MTVLLNMTEPKVKSIRVESITITRNDDRDDIHNGSDRSLYFTEIDLGRDAKYQINARIEGTIVGADTPPLRLWLGLDSHVKSGVVFEYKKGSENVWGGDKHDLGSFTWSGRYLTLYTFGDRNAAFQFLEQYPQTIHLSLEITEYE